MELVYSQSTAFVHAYQPEIFQQLRGLCAHTDVFRIATRTLALNDGMSAFGNLASGRERPKSRRLAPTSSKPCEAVPANIAAINCSELGRQNRSFVQQVCGAHEWPVSGLSTSSLFGWNGVESGHTGQSLRKILAEKSLHGGKATAAHEVLKTRPNHSVCKVYNRQN